MPKETRRSDPNTFAPTSKALDETDIRILKGLEADPRISMSSLAKQVGMSAPATTERVQRMQRDNVIAGFRVMINPAALGYPITAYARIRPGVGQLPKIAALAQGEPTVTECHRITGDDCFLVKLHAPTIEDIQTVLDRFLLFGNTTTAIVVTTPVPLRGLPVELT
ncbi:Lrp/AsnC family transcriptional regulator [Leifsonia sp. NPDC058292]|uniref:Lrp/AsnC family transcriptional regulator n=1 Tax=Leifsonia sp. NPDC058292 TaxID=3346428 RepID=UPI0036D964AE